MASAPKGVIFDQGYRPYDGHYGGRNYALWTMVWIDFQRAFGIGKSWKYKLAVGALLFFMFMPALFLSFIILLFSSVTGPSSAASFPINGLLGAYFSWANNWLLFLCAMIAADQLCNDRRHRVLPLYLARPIQNYDYLLAKSLAIFGALAMVSLVPSLSIYFVKFFKEESLGQVWNVYAQTLGSLFLASGLYAIFFGSFAMALASLTTSRGYAIGGTILIGLLSGLIAVLLYSASHFQYPYFTLLDLASIVGGLKNALFGITNSSIAELFSSSSGVQKENFPPTLDVWQYGLVYLGVVSACVSIVYSVYKREYK
jgi:ABC-2 type transport system permease protein